MNNGLRKKYTLTKADGRPCEGEYFVLKLDSKDHKHKRASRSAVKVYASIIKNHLPELARDLDEWVWRLDSKDVLDSDPLLGVPDPCETCSDRDKTDGEDPCAMCGPQGGSTTIADATTMIHPTES